MPIVVSRSTGEIISKPELTQADRDRGWEAVIRAFAKRHPELLFQEPPAQEEDGYGQSEQAESF